MSASKEPLTEYHKQGNDDIEALNIDGGKEAAHDDDDVLKPVAGSTFLETIAGGVAAASVGTAVVAMIIEQSIVVGVAGILSCGIGPYTYWQQTRLTDIAVLTETHAAVQAEVNRLAAENVRLSKAVTDLSDVVDKLEDVEETLEVMTATQGQSVEAFEDQVKENRDILARMQENLSATVLQNLLSVVIRSDTDGDFQIEGKEVDHLITRIKEINGVELHEDRFRKCIADAGGSLDAVMEMIHVLLSDESSDNDLFTIKH